MNYHHCADVAREIARLLTDIGFDVEATSTRTESQYVYAVLGVQRKGSVMGPRYAVKIRVSNHQPAVLAEPVDFYVYREADITSLVAAIVAASGAKPVARPSPQVGRVSIPRTWSVNSYEFMARAAARAAAKRWGYAARALSLREPRGHAARSTRRVLFEQWQGVGREHPLQKVFWFAKEVARFASDPRDSDSTKAPGAFQSLIKECLAAGVPADKLSAALAAAVVEYHRTYAPEWWHAQGGAGQEVAVE